jgi:hypothetical protein
MILYLNGLNPITRPKRNLWVISTNRYEDIVAITNGKRYQKKTAKSKQAQFCGKNVFLSHKNFFVWGNEFLFAYRIGFLNYRFIAVHDNQQFVFSVISLLDSA